MMTIQRKIRVGNTSIKVENTPKFLNLNEKNIIAYKPNDGPLFDLEQVNNSYKISIMKDNQKYYLGNVKDVLSVSKEPFNNQDGLFYLDESNKLYVLDEEGIAKYMTIYFQFVNNAEFSAKITLV